MTDNNKPTLKQRIKRNAPEIFLGATAVVIGTASFFAIRQSLQTTAADAFEAHAGDPSVDAVIGGEDAFAVLTRRASEILETERHLPLHESDAGLFSLVFDPND